MIVGKDNNQVTRPRDAQMSDFPRQTPALNYTWRKNKAQ